MENWKRIFIILFIITILFISLKYWQSEFLNENSVLKEESKIEENLTNLNKTKCNKCPKSENLRIKFFEENSDKNKNYCEGENMAYPLLLNNKDCCEIKWGKKFNCDLLGILEKYKLTDRRHRIIENIPVSSAGVWLEPAK
ncbi:unnamed protein product [Meloidogyne enterolobii]|uniref:Uncharacterized protein n=2 Tax=Meloidogyne enterolobii TaxID=390850 RepID=A0ACB0Y8B1_MELEN